MYSIKCPSRFEGQIITRERNLLYFDASRVVGVTRFITESCTKNSVSLNAVLCSQTLTSLFAKQEQ